jgi:uncharacterized protein (DUF2267 family)
MSATGLASIDATVQKTNLWLNEIMRELGWENRGRTEHALSTVLHVLRDHLPLNESAQLAAQLPLLIRGIYFEGWKPSKAPINERRWDQFVAHVAEAFALTPDVDAERVTQAVLTVLARHVSDGEIADVKHCLPEDIRRHWR